MSKILAAIDRGNPCGKRDYAMILLITRLGLRGIDVKRLEFADLDWPGNRLSVVGLDCLDGTPLIDIKPYFASTDSVPDAVVGWHKARKG